MDRYTGNRQYKDKGRPVFATTKLPIIPKSEEDKYIFSREGDRLDQLADQFYGDPRLWPFLALANHLGKGSLGVPPGIQLRIPVFSTVRDFEQMYINAERDR